MSDDGTLADGLSTSLFIMGKDKACEFRNAHSDEFDFVLLTDDDSMYISEGIADDYSSDYEYGGNKCKIEQSKSNIVQIAVLSEI